jgi:hypothetical protein
MFMLAAAAFSRTVRRPESPAEFWLRQLRHGVRIATNPHHTRATALAVDAVSAKALD